MTSGRRFLTSALLLVLAVWDAVLATVALAFPAFWFRMFHQAPYVDPQGLLARTGAIWAAFALLQLLAFLKWADAPYWLAIVGGMRLSELFADVTYLLKASSITSSATVGLPLSTATNIIVALFFIQGFLLLQPRERRAQPASAPGSRAVAAEAHPYP